MGCTAFLSLESDRNSDAAQLQLQSILENQFPIMIAIGQWEMKGSRKIKSPFNFQMALSKPSAYLTREYRDVTRYLIEEDLVWVRADFFILY
jgi:hypothetical protein